MIRLDANELTSPAALKAGQRAKRLPWVVNWTAPLTNDSVAASPTPAVDSRDGSAGVGGCADRRPCKNRKSQTRENATG